MLDWLRYRYRLSRLHREKDKIQRFYAKQRTEARAENKGREELHDIASDERYQTDLIDEDIRLLETRYLTDLAEKYSLTTPEREEADRTSRYMFSKESINKLRSAIRAEQKERSELTRSWLTAITPIITAIIGLIGVLIGFILGRR